MDDLIEGFIRLMETGADVTGPVNLGNPNEFSMNELAREVQALVGAETPVSFKELPEDDPKQRQPDITLARTLLGWEPKVQLKEGLHATIRYFRDLQAEVET